MHVLNNPPGLLSIAVPRPRSPHGGRGGRDLAVLPMWPLRPWFAGARQRKEPDEEQDTYDREDHGDRVGVLPVATDDEKRRDRRGDPPFDSSDIARVAGQLGTFESE